jgi:hypothetical protein
MGNELYSKNVSIYNPNKAEMESGEYGERVPCLGWLTWLFYSMKNIQDLFIATN